uniref:CCHC-type domain-containing protein n=1 Tax=Strigamia maritima TaxID=126957 RepID=T1IS23_STRMM
MKKPVNALKERLATMAGYARKLGWYDEKEVLLAKMVIPEILEKLPHALTVQYQIEAKKVPEKKKVKNMFAYLVELVKSYEEIESTEISGPKEDLSGKRGFENKLKDSRTGTMSTFVSSNNGKNGRNPMGCQFCRGNHTPQRCLTISDPITRRRIASEKRLCFNCLGSRHRFNSCPRDFNCPICGEKHHLAICPDVGKIRKQVPRSEENSGRKPEEKKLNEITSMFVSAASIQFIVFEARAKNDFGESVIIRGFIDTASHRSMSPRSWLIILNSPRFESDDPYFFLH